MANKFKDWDNTKKYVKSPYHANGARIGHLEVLSEEIDEQYSEKVEEAYEHSQIVGNPHNTTKSDIGLGNVDNTSDLDKPVSIATLSAIQEALSLPVFNLEGGYNEFVILASIIGRASGTFANGNTIDWQILDNSTNHDSSFFNEVLGNVSNNRLNIRYPTAKSVLSFIISPDETISEYGISMGASVGTSFADVKTTINHSGYMFVVGNSSQTWTKEGDTQANVTVGTFSNVNGYTLVTFGSSFSHIEARGISITYSGSNNYRIERTFSGTSANNQIRFRMVDISTNSPVLTNPTSSDTIWITGAGNYRRAINMRLYDDSVLGRNEFLLNNNFWCIGMFELWMKVLSISSETMLAKWQSKSGVTTYNLYRDTLSDLSTKVLIYSGTNLEFLDSGLTADTVYYYQLCDQADVEITRFNNRTKS